MLKINCVQWARQAMGIFFSTEIESALFSDSVMMHSHKWVRTAWWTVGFKLKPFQWWIFSQMRWNERYTNAGKGHFLCQSTSKAKQHRRHNTHTQTRSIYHREWMSPTNFVVYELCIVTKLAQYFQNSSRAQFQTQSNEQKMPSTRNTETLGRQRRTSCVK